MIKVLFIKSMCLIFWIWYYIYYLIYKLVLIILKLTLYQNNIDNILLRFKKFYLRINIFIRN